MRACSFGFQLVRAMEQARIVDRLAKIVKEPKVFLGNLFFSSLCDSYKSHKNYQKLCDYVVKINEICHC
jgi:hypothetical protein